MQPTSETRLLFSVQISISPRVSQLFPPSETLALNKKPWICPLNLVQRASSTTDPLQHRAGNVVWPLCFLTVHMVSMLITAAAASVKRHVFHDVSLLSFF